ncbi:MAG TPA: helix-turn-helix domain-containing protein, partial [Candidatus Omnitrophota bacterium]|nr:helix-turn-helix domain-containing protein [Candidatus Omnitrophota bacterium]
MPNNNPVKSIGFVLKEARASKNISIEQASKDTKIHLKILKDLETDNFVSIGAIYAKSFIKIYGEYLGLNKDEMKRYFETAVPSVKQALKIPDAQRESRFNFSRMIKKVNFRFIWALVILFLFIYGGVK